MHQYQLIMNDVRIEVLADLATAGRLGRTLELTPSDDDRVDYVIGTPEPVSGGRAQGRLSYGTCRLVRSNDAELLLAAFEAHAANMTASRSDQLQFLGCAVTKGEQLVAAPIDLVGSSAGWLTRLTDDGWVFHPGSRISIGSGGATIAGDFVGRHTVSSSGEFRFAGVVLEGRFGTGTTASDSLGLLLRSCDAHPHLDASDVVQQAQAIMQSDVPTLVWDGSLPSALAWLRGLE